jgi:hypothetical protein
LEEVNEKQIGHAKVKTEITHINLCHMALAFMTNNLYLCKKLITDNGEDIV